MWEELDPGRYNRGLYDGLAGVVGAYIREVNRLQVETCFAHCEMVNRMVEELTAEMVRGMVAVLHSDNKHFNEARFHQRILEAQQPRGLQAK